MKPECLEKLSKEARAKIPDDLTKLHGATIFTKTARCNEHGCTASVTAQLNAPSLAESVAGTKPTFTYIPSGTCAKST